MEENSDKKDDDEERRFVGDDLTEWRNVYLTYFLILLAPQSREGSKTLRDLYYDHRRSWKCVKMLHLKRVAGTKLPKGTKRVC